MREAFSHRYVLRSFSFLFLSFKTYPLTHPLLFIRDDPATLKAQLKELLDMEEAGNMNPTLRLRKKALQEAYQQSIHRQMEKEKAAAEAAKRKEREEPPGMGATTPYLPPLPGHAPPLLPPSALPPGWVMGPHGVPLPPPPPGGPPPPSSSTQRHQLQSQQHEQRNPRQEQLQRHRQLQQQRQGGSGSGIGDILPPPPPGGPPASALQRRTNVTDADGTALVVGPQAPPQTVIEAKSTVVALPKAHHDASLTSMVPSTLLARRQQPPMVPPAGKRAASTTLPDTSIGFGLVPRQALITKTSGSGGSGGEQQQQQQQGEGGGEKNKDDYDAFMASMRELGAL